MSRQVPGLRTLREGLVLVETHMEGFDVRAAVVLGRDRAVVFDTLAHPDDMAPVRGLVAGRPVTVVYSHADWDHAWGTCGLEGWDEVVAHGAARERFAHDVARELASRRAAASGAWGAVELVPPQRTLERALDLDLGDLTLTLSPLPGHTPDSLVGFIPQWGVLLAGDAVETPLPEVGVPEAVPRWIEALEAWGRDPGVSWVVPSHGPVGGSELIHHTAAYLRGLQQPGAAAPPADLAPFYRDTHSRNRATMRDRSGFP